MFKKFILMLLVLSAAALYSKQEIIEKKAGGVDMVYIPSGTFIMGDDASDKDYHPPHRVTISKGFWMSKYEVTQKLYRTVTGANPCSGSKYGEGDDLPVYNISWYEAVEFCNRLSKLCGLEEYYDISDSRDGDNVSQFDEMKYRVEIIKNANGFRLPTEAQWEYGCRAGTRSIFYWGNNPEWDVAGRYSWHLFNAGVKRYNSGQFWWVKYHKVRKTGTRAPNRFGLYDMNGNVAEWCFDRYGSRYYSVSDNTDPAGPEDEFTYRVVRGGSILDSPKDFKSYQRWPVEPFGKTGMNGLRLVLPE